MILTTGLAFVSFAMAPQPAGDPNHNGVCSNSSRNCFVRDPPGGAITSDLAARGDDAMAGDHDRDSIFCHGCPNRATCLFVAACCQILIGQGFSRFDLLTTAVDSATEFSPTLRIDIDSVKVRAPGCEVFL